MQAVGPGWDVVEYALSIIWMSLHWLNCYYACARRMLVFSDSWMFVLEYTHNHTIIHSIRQQRWRRCIRLRAMATKISWKNVSQMPQMSMATRTRWGHSIGTDSHLIILIRCKWSPATLIQIMKHLDIKVVSTDTHKAFSCKLLSFTEILMSRKATPRSLLPQKRIIPLSWSSFWKPAPTRRLRTT